MSYSKTYNDWEVMGRELTVRNGVTIYSAFYNPKATGTRTGEKVQDFKQKIRDGVSASSPYYLDRSKLVEFGEGEIQYSSRSHTKNFQGQHQYYDVAWRGAVSYMRPVKPSHISIADSGVDAIALAKIYKKIREEQQHMNSPAILAEFEDVVRQFGKPFDAIVDLTNRRLNRLELERRGLKGTTQFRKVKWAQVVASSWLEYSFGLAPLIDDTAKAAEALSRWQSETLGLNKPRAKVASRAKETAVQTLPSYAYSGTSTKLKFLCTFQRHTECRVQYVVGLDTSPIAENGSQDRLKQLLGFTPSNWIPAIWEVVPWSWLVDYFTNVQQILEAASTNVTGVKWISKTVVHKTTDLRVSRLDAGLSAKAFGVSFNDILLSMDTEGKRVHGGYSKVVRTTMNRTVPATLGVPPLALEIPVNWKQHANLAAVLLSRRPSSSALWLT